VKPWRRLGAEISPGAADVPPVDRGQDELAQDLAHCLLVVLRERHGLRHGVARLVHERPVRVAGVAGAGEVDREEDQRRGYTNDEADLEHAATPAR